MELGREGRFMPGRVIALAVGLLVALVLSMASGYVLRGAQTASPNVTGAQGVAPQATPSGNAAVPEGELQPTHGQMP